MAGDLPERGSHDFHRNVSGGTASFRVCHSYRCHAYLFRYGRAQPHPDSAGYGADNKSRHFGACQRAGPAAQDPSSCSFSGASCLRPRSYTAGPAVHAGEGCFCHGAVGLLFFSPLPGTLREAAASFVIGAVLRTVLFLVSWLKPSSFVSAVTGGAVISLCSGLAVWGGCIQSTGNVSIAVLMALVPGVAIVNAIRDIIAGDLVAGSARLLDAFVTAAALSIGAAFGLVLFPVEKAYTSAILARPELVPAFILAFFASGAFAYFYYSLRRDLFWSALFGAFGWIVYLIVSSFSVGPAAGSFAGALAVGLCSELVSRIFGKPATVYIVPGIIPLVPGGGMYETMLYSVWGNRAAASAAGFSTLSAAFAIAVALALVSSFFRLLDRRLPRQ